MALHYFLPFVAASLMAIVWVSTLGGSTSAQLSGAALAAVVFWTVLKARRKAVPELGEEAAKR